MDLLINYKYFNFKTLFKYINDINKLKYDKVSSVYYSYSNHTNYIEVIIVGEYLNVQGFLIFNKKKDRVYKLERVEMIDDYLTPKMKDFIDKSYNLSIEEKELKIINEKVSSKLFYDTR